MTFNHEPKQYDCPFCRLSRGESDEYNSPNDIVYQDDNVLAFVSPKWWVKNKGHVLIVPKKHVENVYDIEESLLSQLYTVGKRMAVALKQAYNCDGTSFRQHNEPAGNQEVWHFHLHVFPRYTGDDLYTNHLDTMMVNSQQKKPYVEKLLNVITHGIRQ